MSEERDARKLLLVWDGALHILPSERGATSDADQLTYGSSSLGIPAATHFNRVDIDVGDGRTYPVFFAVGAEVSRETMRVIVELRQYDAQRESK